MADQTQLAWTATPTAFGTLTNLHSLADGNIWNSGVIASGSPTDMIIQISYNLVFNTGPAAGDYLAFWVIGNDDDGSTPYWPAGISETEGEITTGTTPLIETVLAAVGQPHHIHPFRATAPVTFRGTFFAHNFTPDWQLLIRAVGEALSASGNVVRYRYATPQIVSV